MTDYLLVANAAAGTADDDAVAAARKALAAAGSVEVARTGSPEDLAEVLGA